MKSWRTDTLSSVVLAVGFGLYAGVDAMTATMSPDRSAISPSSLGDHWVHQLAVGPMAPPLSPLVESISVTLPRPLATPVPLSVGQVLLGQSLASSDTLGSPAVTEQQLDLNDLIAPPPIVDPRLPPQTLPAPAPTITIKAVGDIVMGTDYPDDRLPPHHGQALFDRVKGYLTRADIVFGNLEGTLTTYPYAAKPVSDRSFVFRAPPYYAQTLRDAGFTVLSVANNHAMDFYETGFAETIRAVEQAGMGAVGRKGQILYREVNGITVAMIGFAYLDFYNSMHDLETAKALIQQAEQRADIVIVSVHAGAEGSQAVRVQNAWEQFYGENRGNSVLFARRAIDYGADLVLGHGPHVVRAMEVYQGRLIAYSLGNFVGYETLSTSGNQALSMILEVHLDQQGQLVGGRVIPVIIDPPGIPRIDQGFRTVGLLRQLIQQDFPRTPLTLDRQGHLVIPTSSP